MWSVGPPTAKNCQHSSTGSLLSKSILSLCSPSMEGPLLPVSTPAASGEEATADDVEPAHTSLCSVSPLPTSTVLVRLATLLALAILSLWASSEASRGFALDVVNAAAGTPAGRRFDLMFVSNGRASRAVLDASRAAQRALYPAAASAEKKKPVHHVTLRLADGNLSASVVVQRGGVNEFVLHVSSAVMLAAEAGRAMRTAVHRGMARVWLWDGRGGAPEALLDAMADYLATLDGTARGETVDSGASAAATVEGWEENVCWPPSSQGRDAAVRFLRRCEEKRRGFVARLNSAMRRRWRAGMVEEALGSPVGRVCRTQSTSAWGGGADGSVGGTAAGWTGTALQVTSLGSASV